MTLTVLTCIACGAPLPIVDAAQVLCGACGAVREVPPEYVALRRYAQTAGATRRQAEQAYRSLVEGSVSKDTPTRFLKFGLPSMVFGIPLLLWMTQDLAHWALRTWVVFGVFFPLLFGCLLFAGLDAAAGPGAYLDAIGGRIRPGPPTPGGAPTCGACGGPLARDPDALCATCDYCLADSWLAELPEGHAEGTERVGQNLADLVRAASFRTFDFRLFVLVSLIVAGGFLLLLWIGFS